MVHSRFIILPIILALSYSLESQESLIRPAQASIRSPNNIFNRINRPQNDKVILSTSPVKNETRMDNSDNRSFASKNSNTIYEASDSIVQQLRRRLGVGPMSSVRSKYNRPSDENVEGHENMHRFFDKLVMSMATEVPTKSPVLPVPIPIIPPMASPTKIPVVAPVVSTIAPVNMTTTLPPAPTFICFPPITEAKREEQILSILNDITPESVILTTGTSQNKAFNWLVNIDDLQLCPDRGIDIIQRYTIAVTYFSLGGDDWFQCGALLTSSASGPCIGQERHLSKSNVCDWFNVTCSIDGNITGIVLEDNNLVGILPNELRALDQLVNISFANNTMVSGSIPMSYGSLSALKKLDISKNVIIDTIPATICNASSLRALDFKMNVLAGTIPTCIGELASLSSLSLERNILTGSLPTHISRLSLLETLSISENDLTGTIPTTLGSNLALRAVSLQQNSLSGGLPTIVGLLTNLESMNFFFNQLNGTIPTELGNLDRLENLFLHFNEIIGTMPNEICALRDTKNGVLRQLTSDCGTRGRVVCPADCCTACF